MSNVKAYFSNLINAVTGKSAAPQEPKAEVKVVRRTALSVGTKKSTAKVVDSAEKRHAEYVKGLKDVANSPVLKDGLEHVADLTQEQINAEVYFDAAEKSVKRQKDIYEAIASIERRQLELAVSVDDKRRRGDELAAKARELAIANKAKAKETIGARLSIEELVAKAKASAPAVETPAPAPSEEPKTQRKQIEPPTRKAPPQAPAFSSDAQRVSCERLAGWLTQAGYGEDATKIAYELVTADETQRAGRVLIKIQAEHRSSLLPALVGMNKAVYGPLYTPKKEQKDPTQQEVQPSVSNEPSNPNDDEVNPQPVISAAPSKRDISPVGEAGKTQEVVPAIDGKI